MTSYFFSYLLSGLDGSVGHWNSMGISLKFHFVVLWSVKHRRKPCILPFTEMPQFPLNCISCGCCLNVDGHEKPNCCCCRQTFLLLDWETVALLRCDKWHQSHPHSHFSCKYILYRWILAWPETAFLAVTISPLRGGNVCSLLSVCIKIKGTPAHCQRTRENCFFPSL